MADISKSADKALRLLGLVAKHPGLTPTDYAELLLESRTVTQRLLTTLMLRSYILNSDGRYSMSGKLCVLADSVEPALRRAIVAPMRETMRDLQETVVFQISDGDQAVVLEEVLPGAATQVVVRHHVGQRTPLWLTANGLALLAHSTRSIRDRIIATAVEPEKVRLRVTEVMNAGFARTSDEYQAGVTGLAVPVVATDGSLYGSVGALRPTDRDRPHDGTIQSLQACATVILQRVAGLAAVHS